MRHPGLVKSRRVLWLGALLALLSLGHAVNPSWWAEACSLVTSARGGTRVASRLSGEGVPRAADPWALSPSGSWLDSGYALGQERPGLLP